MWSQHRSRSTRPTFRRTWDSCASLLCLETLVFCPERRFKAACKIQKSTLCWFFWFCGSISRSILSLTSSFHRPATWKSAKFPTCSLQYHQGVCHWAWRERNDSELSTGRTTSPCASCHRRTLCSRCRDCIRCVDRTRSCANISDTLRPRNTPWTRVRSRRCRRNYR